MKVKYLEALEGLSQYDQGWIAQCGRLNKWEASITFGLSEDNCFREKGCPSPTACLDKIQRIV